MVEAAPGQLDQSVGAPLLYRAAVLLTSWGVQRARRYVWNSSDFADLMTLKSSLPRPAIETLEPDPDDDQV